MFSFSKQHTTVSFATRAASTSVLGKENRAETASQRRATLLTQQRSLEKGERNKQRGEKRCQGKIEWLSDVGKGFKEVQVGAQGCWHILKLLLAP